MVTNPDVIFSNVAFLPTLGNNGLKDIFPKPEAVDKTDSDNAVQSLPFLQSLP